MNYITNKKSESDLNSFRGWLLVFLLLHVPIAFINFSHGVYMLAVFLKSSSGLPVAILSLLLCLLLPTSIILLFRRKSIFRIFYVLYSTVTAANYLIEHGINITTVIFTLLFTVPWLLYVFLSRRIKAVLRNAQPELESSATKTQDLSNQSEQPSSSTGKSNS